VEAIPSPFLVREGTRYLYEIKDNAKARYTRKPTQGAAGRNADSDVAWEYFNTWLAADWYRRRVLQEKTTASTEVVLQFTGRVVQGGPPLALALTQWCNKKKQALGYAQWHGKTQAARPSAWFV
jgi:hypothetical protein